MNDSVKFKVEFTRRAAKDLKKMPTNEQRQLLKESLLLETNPFPFKNKIKRIKGVKFPCYRLRIDLPSAAYRIFYGIDNDIVYVLRVISKKDSNKVIKQLQE